MRDSLSATRVPGDNPVSMADLMRTMKLATLLVGLLATRSVAQHGRVAAISLTRLETGSCPQCVLTIQPVATIGKPDDPELIPEYSSVWGLAGGGFVVGGGRSDAAPLQRYDRTGHSLGPLGHIGDGPGEYRRVQSVAIARGDSISILGSGVITTISTATGRGRTARLAPKTQALFHIVLPDGSVLLNNNAQYQPAFELLSPTAVLRENFGPAQPAIALADQGGRKIGDEYATMQALANAQNGGAWAANRYYRHHLTHIDPAGNIVHEIDRAPAWFQPYGFDDINERMYRLGELRAARPAVITGIGGDDAGHLFVMSRVADAAWKKDPNAPPPHPRGGEYPVEHLEPTGGIDRYVDTIVEVYDDKSGAFIGSWRADVLLTGMTETGFLYTRQQDADGVISFQVFRLRVTTGQ